MPVQTEKLRWTLSLLCLALLLVGLYLVMEPFLVPLVWAGIVVLATWPLYRRLLKLLGGRDSFAALVMTSALALLVVCVVVPLLIMLASELQNLVTGSQDWFSQLIQKSDELLRSAKWIPIGVRSQLSKLLGSVGTGREEILKIISVYPGEILKALTSALKGMVTFGFNAVVFLITAFFFYRGGKEFGGEIVSATQGLGGERFLNLLEAVRATIRGAVYGILATAIAQGILAGIGYWLTGAPIPVLLGVTTIVFSLIPFGTPFVYVPTAVAVFVEVGPLWGILLLAWGIGVVSLADNVIRPIFISQTTRIPMLLVLFGAVGGIISFGLVGIFLGPSLIAIALALWREWIAHEASSHGKTKKTV